LVKHFRKSLDRVEIHQDIIKVSFKINYSFTLITRLEKLNEKYRIGEMLQE